MGCLHRSYPRFEYFEKIGLLKLSEDSYDKVKLSIKNPDYKDIAINKFVHAYLYDLATHGLKIDFDRYLLLHLLGYKNLVEPFVSPKHHIDFIRLDNRLHAMLLQDEMLKVADERFKAFFEEFKEDLARLTPKQRLEVVANLVRQLGILQGGKWDIVDKWIAVEKSLGLHALKSLTGSLLFWNYVMLTLGIREHYQTLLEKEEILIQAGQGGYIKWDDWTLVKKWYDRAGSLTDVEYHLKNAQESLEKYIFELDWISTVAGDLGSEFLAYRIAKGITSFLWNTAKVLSILHPAGRLARGAFLLAKWLSQSIIAFATWLGLEWALDALIQVILRTPLERLRNFLGLPEREFGLLPEEFDYLKRYFISKEVYDLSITDEYASQLFAKLTPKGQAVLLSLIHRARIRKIAREAQKRIRQAVKDILPKLPSLPDMRAECFNAKLPSAEEMFKLFNTLTELYDAQAKLNIIALTGNDEENITTQVRDMSSGNTIRKVFEYSQPPPKSKREENPNYPPAEGSLDAQFTYHTYDIDGLLVNSFSFSFSYGAGAPCQVSQYSPPPYVAEGVFNAYGYAFGQNCNQFYSSQYSRNSFGTTDECNEVIQNRGKESGFSIYIKRRPYISNEYETGDKSIVKLIRLLFKLKPSYALRLDENLYRLYMRPLSVSEKITASKLIMLPSTPEYYSFWKRIDYEVYMRQGYYYASSGNYIAPGIPEEEWGTENRGKVEEIERLSKMHLNTYAYYSFVPDVDMIYIYYYYYVYYLPPVDLEKRVITEYRDGDSLTIVNGSLDYLQFMKYESKSDSLIIPVVEKKEITPVSLKDASEYPPDDFDIPDVYLSECIRKIQISD